jgi:RNA polymerase sigma-70 factor (ECF subfamily)
MTHGLISEPRRKELQTAWSNYLDIVEPLRPDLHRYCRRVTGNVWDAEDLVQDTLLRGFGSIGRRDDQRAGCSQPGDVQNPRAYLFRIATNLWVDSIRRAELEKRQPDVPPLQPQVLNIDATREAASTLIERTSPQARAAVVLKDIFDFTLEEIADMLTTSVGAIKSALHRGRSDLEKPLPQRGRNLRRPSRDLIDAFVEAFNARDIARVTALLLEQVSIEVQGVGGERGRDANWVRFSMSGYRGDRIDIHWLECRMFEAEPLVLHLRKDESRQVLEEVWRMEEEDGEIARIRDYCYCPETLQEIATKFGLDVVTHGYYNPEKERVET